MKAIEFLSAQVLRIFNAGSCPKVVQTTEGCHLRFFENACHNEREARGEQEPVPLHSFHIAVRNGTRPSGRGEVQFAPI